MSSHHIVRDGQEPALIILSLKSVDNDILEGLLEWSPTVILPDHLIEEVVGRGFKFDVVLCEESCHSLLSNKLELYFPIKFIIASPHLWFERTIDYLIKSDHHALSIMMDHFDDSFISKRTPHDFNVIIFENNFKWHKVNSCLKKWFPKGQEIKINGSNFEIAGSTTVHDSQQNHYITNEHGRVTITCSESIWFGERIVRP